MKIYYIRNHEVHEGVVIKKTKRGTAYHVELDGKVILVSMVNLWLTRDEAEKELEKRNNIKKQKEWMIKKSIEKIDKIMEQIFQEFGVDVPFLVRPYTVEDAEKLYRKIKREKS